MKSYVLSFCLVWHIALAATSQILDEEIIKDHIESGNFKALQKINLKIFQESSIDLSGKYLLDKSAQTTIFKNTNSEHWILIFSPIQGSQATKIKFFHWISVVRMTSTQSSLSNLSSDENYVQIAKDGLGNYVLGLSYYSSGNLTVLNLENGSTLGVLPKAPGEVTYSNVGGKILVMVPSYYFASVPNEKKFDMFHYRFLPWVNIFQISTNSVLNVEIPEYNKKFLTNFIRARQYFSSVNSNGVENEFLRHIEKGLVKIGETEK